MTMLSLKGSNISNELSLARSCLIEHEQYTLDSAPVEKDFKRYKDALDSTIAENLNLIDELPPLKYLSKTELRDYFRKKLDEDLRKDEVFEKSVELSKYAKSISTYLQDYYREIFDHLSNCNKRMESEILDACRMYFNSDLPMRILKAIENSILMQRDYVDIYGRTLHREQFTLLRNRNNHKKFEKLCTIHNNWIDQFSTLLEDSDRTRLKLFWYIDFNNSKTVEDIFKVKKIEAASLDMKIVEGYATCLEKMTEDIKLIVEKNTEFHPIEMYDTENGSRSIREIMDLLATSEV